jgi:hypothetical protein
MEKREKKIYVDNISIASLSIFLVCFLKYILVNWFDVIPIYGASNRLVSWMFFLPLSIVGLLMSIWMIFKFRNALTRKNGVINLLFCLPMILYWIIFMI